MLIRAYIVMVGFLLACGFALLGVLVATMGEGRMPVRWGAAAIDAPATYAMGAAWIALGITIFCIGLLMAEVGPRIPIRKMRDLSFFAFAAGFIATLLIGVHKAYAEAPARHLRSVAAGDLHDPLFVDLATVKRSGARVAFQYVLNVPVALESREARRRWKSNEMEAVIDCGTRTYSIGRVLAYSGPEATGNIVGSYSSTPAERKPAPIVRASTFDYLARHLCGKESR